MTSTGGLPDIVFRGTDGTEAEEFITAIERLAFTEGWYRDRERVLSFARSCLRHKALRWFARLDPSKKNDWDLFVEAVLDQYPLVEAPTETEISTPVWSATTFSPSAATVILPSGQGFDQDPNIRDGGHATGVNTRHSIPPHTKTYDASILGRQVGILRVVVEDGTTPPEYIWRGQGSASSDQLRTTIDRQEALVVSFIPSPEPHSIGCMNSAHNFSDLFLYYYGPDPPQLILRAGNGVVAIPEEGTCPRKVSKVWNVASDGSLEASVSAFDPNSCDAHGGYKRKLEDFKTSEVHLHTSGTSVRFVKPGTPLWQDDLKRNTRVNRYDFKARIVFEPLFPHRPIIQEFSDIDNNALTSPQSCYQSAPETRILRFLGCV